MEYKVELAARAIRDIRAIYRYIDAETSARATAKTKCGGLSTTAAKAPPPVEMTEVDGDYERGYRTGNDNRKSFDSVQDDSFYIHQLLTLCGDTTDKPLMSDLP